MGTSDILEEVQHNTLQTTFKGTSFVLSAGFLTWALRGASLLASVAASVTLVAVASGAAAAVATCALSFVAVSSMLTAVGRLHARTMSEPWWRPAAVTLHASAVNATPRASQIALR